MKKLLAFTLAETLIVIGIIGVVSALTLPNLNSSTGEKEKVAKVMKIYQNLDDAITRAIAVYGPVDEWYSGDVEIKYTRRAERILEFMKISKNCGFDNEGCWSLSRENELCDSWEYRVILADGTALNICPKDKRIYTDIDGQNKGSYVYGKDVFVFDMLFLTTGAFTPAGQSNVTSCFATRENCAAWVINNGNMDYLNADSSGKCSNGKVLSETNVSCK